MRFILTLATALAVAPAFAQAPAPAAKQADSMQILREKLKTDKKLVIAANMELTETEAKKFWPLYEEYQKELARINDQLATVIVAYAKEYNAGSLTDKKATELLNQSVAVEEAETKRKRSFIPKLAKVLPGRKAARYLQLENKIRALVKYEIAGEVPLAP
jgi:Spy/CpxP family protein refolding chaperone